jgi:hypothetical protein
MVEVFIVGYSDGCCRVPAIIMATTTRADTTNPVMVKASKHIIVSFGIF